MKRRDVLKTLGVTASAAAAWGGASLPVRADEAVKSVAASFAVPVRALVRRDGALAQPIRLTPPGRLAGARVVTSVDGRKVDERVVASDGRTFDVFVPAVDAKKTVTVSMVASETLSTTVDLLPVRRMRVYVLPHSHHDLGYTDIQAHIEDKQVRNIFRGIELAKKTAGYPEGARFVWNLEVLWGADLFMRRGSAEDKALLVEAIQRGWVALNGSYANELTGLCREEELLELFRYGVELGRSSGRPIDSAMFSDVPGYVWGTVSAMAQAGIRYFSAAPNSFDRIGRFMATWQDRPFWWVSPSGREKVLFWVPWHGYALSHGIDEPDEAWVGSYQARMDDVNFPYDISYIRWSGHGDNAEPDPGISEFVRRWNDTYEWPRFTIASTSTAFADFERNYGSQLPSFQGDLTPYWEDGAGSSARETAENREAANALVQANALAAMAGDATPGRDAEAWRNVLLYSEHTWGADESISKPDSDMTRAQWSVKQAFADSAVTQGRERVAAGMAALVSSHADGGRFTVANTTSWPRTDVVIVPAAASHGGDRVTDAQGKPVPSQRLSTGELAVQVDVPAFAVSGYTVVAGNAMAPTSTVRVHDHVLANGLIEARLDAHSGDVTELYLQGDKRNLVDRGNGHSLNRFLFLAGDDLAGIRSSEAATITIEEHGPLVATLKVTSQAPGCRDLVRRVRLAAGQDYLALENVVDKLRAPFEQKPDGKQAVAKESLQFAFPFAVDGGQMVFDVPFAQVRPEHDQLPGACKNWLPAHAFVDIAGTDRGVTCVTLDAPLVEVGGITATKLNSQTDPDVWIRNLAPSQTFYSWVMNNHWGTNYRAFQEGPVTFRYVVRPYRAAQRGTPQRFSQERMQPLRVTAGAPRTATESLLTVEPAQVAVRSLAPSRDGQAWIVRLFNASPEAVDATLSWKGGKAGSSIRLSNLAEDALATQGGSVAVAGWGLVTLRIGDAQE